VTSGSTADAVIIGAGIVGCSIAHQLARRGLNVVVVDKGPTAGAGSTSASSAIVRYNYSTRDGVAAAWESSFHWRAWEEHLECDDEPGLARFVETGGLVFDVPALRTSTVLASLTHFGVPYEELTRDEIEARFPAVDARRFGPPRSLSDPDFWADPDGDLNGFVTPGAGYVDDPQLAAHNLMTAARRFGAEFRFHTEVVAIAASNGRAQGVDLASGDRIASPVVVNAAGPHSARINELAGVLDDFRIRTRPLRQEVHTVAAPDEFRLGHSAPFVADADLGVYLRAAPSGRLLIGGLEPECDELQWVDDPDDFGVHPTVDVWEAQVTRSARRLPSLSVPTRPNGLGALYDVSDDWIPIYDRSSLPGYYVAIGTSGNQFKNAPVVGLFMAELILRCEGGHDHDASPIEFVGPRTGNPIDLGHYSRRRERHAGTTNVLA
jgi:sarcosine oxidase subunit beta